MSNLNSPYQRPILESAITDLTARLNTYKNGPHYKAAVRNPAYCKMFWPGGEVPVDTINWNETYREGFALKPPPALNSVTLVLGANENNNLSLQAEFSIKVFTKDDFATVVDTLCKNGNLLTFDWGYRNPFGPGYTSKKISGFKLATFTFNTEPDGTYNIEGVATGPAHTLEGLHANAQVRAPNNPARYFKNDNKQYPVTSIIELLTYWAQGNGKKSIDKMEDGEVLVIPAGTRNDGESQPLGSIMIFDSSHLNQKGIGAALGRLMASVTTTNSELNKTNNIIYISLETIVGMFNSEVLPMYLQTTKDVPNGKDFADLKIAFDDDLSFSYIDTYIRSAYPTKILLMDPILADYKNTQGEGKNFWEDVKNKDVVKTVDSVDDGRNKINLKRIFIERSIILSALTGAAEKADSASKVDVRVNRDSSIIISEFFKKIFEEIKIATGERISLTLSMHPDVFDGNDKKAWTLYVFDETNGYGLQPRPVWEFDPINGDGTTRTFSIKSDVGSQNFQNSQYHGPTLDTDALARAEGIDALVDAGRAKNYKKALKDIEGVIKNPGQLGDSGFDEVHMQSLAAAYKALKDGEGGKKKFNNVVFIGMGADVEIDGVWGIGPGCGIWSTQMPKRYRDNHLYFGVMSTTHKFDGATSDWSTTFNGVIQTAETVKYLPNG